MIASFEMKKITIVAQYVRPSIKDAAYDLWIRIAYYPNMSDYKAITLELAEC